MTSWLRPCFSRRPAQHRSTVSNRCKDHRTASRQPRQSPVTKRPISTARCHHHIEADPIRPLTQFAFFDPCHSRQRKQGDTFNFSKLPCHHHIEAGPTLRPFWIRPLTLSLVLIPDAPDNENTPGCCGREETQRRVAGTVHGGQGDEDFPPWGDSPHCDRSGLKVLKRESPLFNKRVVSCFELY